jgi:hypothetical protein
MSRTSREIKVRPDELRSNNVSVKIGAMDKKEAPPTIYLSFSFWTKPNGPISNGKVQRTNLESEIRKCYEKVNKEVIRDNEMFSYAKRNIFIVNIPENFNYNEKKNYVSFELYLHTANVNKRDKFPLNSKKGNKLYEQAVTVANSFLSNSLFLNQSEYEVCKTK